MNSLVYNKLIYCLYGVYSVEKLLFVDKNTMNLKRDNVIVIC
jgi:hypothetical protein